MVGANKAFDVRQTRTREQIFPVENLLQNQQMLKKNYADKSLTYLMKL